MWQLTAGCRHVVTGLNLHQEKPHLLIRSYKLEYVKVREKSGDISSK